MKPQYRGLEEKDIEILERERLDQKDFPIPKPGNIYAPRIKGINQEEKV